MKSHKPKAESLREASTDSLQTDADAWWEDSGNDHSVMVLKDEPQAQVEGIRHPFDLEERTARFGESVIGFLKKIPRNPENNRLIDQPAGCSTAVGANYSEASEAVSKRDFRVCISRRVKEAKETRHFLRMAVASEPQLAPEARPLYREATELVLIFGSMFRK
jgi:four helix bundle protein